VRGTLALIVLVAAQAAFMPLPDSDWLFLGDSITANGITDDLGINRGSAEATTADSVRHIDAELERFSGRYVAISFGSNDATGTVTPASFAENYRALIAKVRAAGKTAVVPTIPYSSLDYRREHIPLYNARLDELGDMIRGPDLFTYFKGHPEQLVDGLHPSAAGYAAYRRLWLQAKESLGERWAEPELADRLLSALPLTIIDAVQSGVAWRWLLGALVLSGSAIAALRRRARRTNARSPADRRAT
jgi:lysophospholipase L1-like esterase